MKKMKKSGPKKMAWLYKILGVGVGIGLILSIAIVIELGFFNPTPIAGCWDKNFPSCIVAPSPDCIIEYYSNRTAMSYNGSIVNTSICYIDDTNPPPKIKTNITGINCTKYSNGFNLSYSANCNEICTDKMNLSPESWCDCMSICNEFEIEFEHCVPKIESKGE